MMNTLDEWEAFYKIEVEHNSSRSFEGIASRRILAFIDIVRKKDESMHSILSDGLAPGPKSIIKNALVLTEKLK